MGEYFYELFHLILYCLKSTLFMGTFAVFFVRRENFVQANILFSAGGALSCILGAGVWIWSRGNVALEFGIYGFLTLLGVAWLAMCYQGSPSKYIFYYLYAQILQICYRALEGSLQLFGVLPLFWGEYVAREVIQRMASDLVSLLVCLAFCLCAYLVNRHRSRSVLSAQPTVERAYLVLVISNAVVTSGLFYLRVSLGESDTAYILALYVLIMAYGISTIYSQHNILLRSQSEQLRQKTEYENLILEQLSQEAFHQYTSLKKTMELLNLRCHDVKHQLRGLMQNREGNSQYFDQLIDTIQIYDCVIKTGNEALDVVLTDAALRCNNAGISFTCLVDGSLLSGMETPDIYSLFGNAVDNAIEYLQTVELDGKFLRIGVETKGGFTLIRAENFFQGRLLRDEEGVLQTTKGDPAGHGYGVKSMERIAQKYGGTLTVKEEDHMFRLVILLPRAA